MEIHYILVILSIIVIIAIQIATYCNTTKKLQNFR